ncbi:hypothetical protein [Dankookia sp. P2]|uniref:RraA family protein n=1 Tax=Dankookia sp. P2 TaxID=3423955 RepID=UPI003D664903
MGWVAKRGITAVVIDGAIRDAAQPGEMDLGVWAHGAPLPAPYKDGPGEICCPVACGG